MRRAYAQQPQPPQFAAEPQPQINPLEQVLATVPVAARGWLRNHPEYLSDPEKNAQIQHAHLVAARETGDAEFGPKYYARLEQHLGLRPPHQPQQARPASRPAVERRTSVSAPPHRESVSLATGRPTTDRLRLTSEEAEFARMLGLSEADYATQKALMLRRQQ